MDEIKIYRDVFGPGERRSGARFRDEVRVCTCCRTVVRTLGTRWDACLSQEGKKVPRRTVLSEDYNGPGLRSSRWLDALVPTPCKGKLFPPSAELGWRYHRSSK